MDARGARRADALARLRAAGASTGERNGVELYHASIRDPIWEYVIDPHTAAVCLELQSPDRLIGHSHVPLIYGYDGDTFLGRLRRAARR